MSEHPQRRHADRVPTRLRPAKLLSAEGTFLADCAITDRSPRGARVRLFGAPPLPSSMILFDETQTQAWPTRLAWGVGTEAGLALLSAPLDVPPEIVRRIAGRYYAVPD